MARLSSMAVPMGRSARSMVIWAATGKPILDQRGIDISQSLGKSSLLYIDCCARLPYLLTRSSWCSNECKRRKIKCNGQTPCQRCGNLSLDCVYAPNCCTNSLKDSAYVLHSPHSPLLTEPGNSSRCRTTSLCSKNKSTISTPVWMNSETDLTPSTLLPSTLNLHKMPQTVRCRCPCRAPSLHSSRRRDSPQSLCLSFTGPRVRCMAWTLHGPRCKRWV